MIAVAPTAVPAPAARPLPEPAPEPDEMRDAANDVLDGAEFVVPEPSPIERAREWVSERIADLVDAASGGSSVLGLVVLVLVVAGVVWLVVRFGRTVRTDPSGVALPDDGAGRSPVDWRRQAAAEEARGEPKEALRSLYRAIVAELVVAGVVDDVAGRTTGEYRVEVRRTRPDAAQAFDAASDRFERAWFADEPVGADDLATVRRIDDQISAMTRRGVRS